MLLASDIAPVVTVVAVPLLLDILTTGVPVIVNWNGPVFHTVPDPLHVRIPEPKDIPLS